MRKRKSNDIKSAGSVHLEIDYDKLAEAIVKAEQAKDNNRETDTREWMKFLISLAMWAVALLHFAGAIMLGKLSFDAIKLFESKATLLSGLRIVVTFAGCLFCLSTIFFITFAERKIAKENDRNYVATIFSNVVSFTALIVAIVALWFSIR